MCKEGPPHLHPLGVHPTAWPAPPLHDYHPVPQHAQLARRRQACTHTAHRKNVVRAGQEKGRAGQGKAGQGGVGCTGKLLGPASQQHTNVRQAGQPEVPALD
jgi:hypothetical protein